jgi:hypothetical protein
LNEVRDEQVTLREYVEDLKKGDATLDPKQGSCVRCQEKFETLATEFKSQKDPIHQQMAQVMLSFLAGMFAGGAKFAAIRDNLDLKRWFRLPKNEPRALDPRTSPRGRSDRSGGADAGACVGCPHLTPRAIHCR